MQSVNFSVSGDAYVWVGATDSSLSDETKGFLWRLLATQTGLIEVSEYQKALIELMASGYLIMEGDADAVIVPSPFAQMQAQAAFAKNHPLATLKDGKRRKQKPLGVRFFPKFQAVFNDLKSPNWPSCETITKARTDALGRYLRECKARSQGEFLIYGLNVFERALMYAAADQWWKTKRHPISVFLKVKSDHPFDLAELYRPNAISPASAVASSWIPATSLRKRLTASTTLHF